MDSYKVEITIEREETDSIGFGTAEEVERSLKVRAGLDERTVEVEKEPDETVASAVEGFLSDLGVSSVALSDD